MTHLAFHSRRRNPTHALTGTGRPSTTRARTHTHVYNRWRYNIYSPQAFMPLTLIHRRAYDKIPRVKYSWSALKEARETHVWCLTDLYPFLRLLKSWSRAALGGFVVNRPGTGALVSTGHVQRKSSALSRFPTALPRRSRSCAWLRPIRIAWMLTMNGGDEVLQFPPRAPALHCSPRSDLKILKQRRRRSEFSSALSQCARRTERPAVRTGMCTKTMEEFRYRSDSLLLLVPNASPLDMSCTT